MLKPEAENFWDSELVKNHDFARDKEIVGELQGKPVGREGKPEWQEDKSANA